MTEPRFTFADLKRMTGEVLGTSDWMTVDQPMVDQFADCTGDHQWIHIDVERARRESPFGGPVAHGYLTLSLIAALSGGVGVIPKGTEAALNYGLNSVRFLAPVVVGSRVRLHIKLISFVAKGSQNFLMTTENTMEIEGVDKPALVAEALALLVARQEVQA